MKITTRQLRQIIREEVQALLEDPETVRGTPEADPFKTPPPSSGPKSSEDPEGEKRKVAFMAQMKKEKPGASDDELQKLWIKNGAAFCAKYNKARSLFGGPETRKKVFGEAARKAHSRRSRRS